MPARWRAQGRPRPVGKARTEKCADHDERGELIAVEERESVCVCARARACVRLRQQRGKPCVYVRACVCARAFEAILVSTWGIIVSFLSLNGLLIR